MPITPEELVRVLAMLAEEEKLKVAVKETLKGGAMAGTGAVIGGLMGGPVGIAIGGLAGTMTARWYGRGKYTEVSQIITQLDREKRDELHHAYLPILEDYKQEDGTSLNHKLTMDGELRERMLNTLKTFLKDNLKETLLDSHTERGKAD